MKEREAARAVAKCLGSALEDKVEKKGIRWPFIAAKYIFRDFAGRKYEVRYNKKKKCFFVDVGKKQFVVDEKIEKIKMATDEDVAIAYARYFLDKKGYNVTTTNIKPSSLFSYAKGLMEVDNNIVFVDITKTQKGLEVRLADSEIPYICSANHQFVLHLLPYVELKKTVEGLKPDLENLLHSYEEAEIKEAKKNPLSWIRKKIYGTELTNLRLVVEEDGILPELRNLIKSNIKINLGTAMTSTSAAARILEKLGPLAWFSLAGGILAGAAALVAESLYMKKGTKISEHLPESRQARLAEQYSFSELRGIRTWDNFEKAFFKHYLNLTEEYRKKKELLYDIVEQHQQDKDTLVHKFKECVGIADDRLDKLIANLKPIELEKVVAILHSRFQAARDAGLLRQSAKSELEHYINSEFVDGLRKKPLGEAKKRLAEEFRYVTRFPDAKESYKLVHETNKDRIRHNLIGHILFGINLAAGYTTYLPIKAQVYLPYFLFMGGAMTYNAVAFGRIAHVFVLQGLIKELEKDSTINAMSAWNEYTHIESRNSWIFNSLGIMAGFAAKAAAPFTAGLSQFAAELTGLYLRYSGYKDWLKFSKDFEARYANDKGN